MLAALFRGPSSNGTGTRTETGGASACGSPRPSCWGSCGIVLLLFVASALLATIVGGTFGTGAAKLLVLRSET